MNAATDRKLWAKQFPLNSLLDGLGQKKKLKVESHAAGKDTDGKGDASLKTCDRHDLTLEFFCEDHMSLYCAKCVALNHRRCVSVQPVPDYCHALRNGPGLTDIKDSVKKAVRAMNIIVNGSNQHMKDLDLKKQAALDNIRRLRREVDAFLDRRQTKMEQEIIQVHQEEEEWLRKGLGSHTSVLNDVVELNNAFDSKQMLEDDVFMISVYQQSKMAVDCCREMVLKARRQWQSKTLEHRIHFDNSKLENHFSMGSVTASTLTRTLPVKDDLSLILSQQTVTGESNFNIKLDGENDCCATGILYMSSGRILVADRANKNLKMFREDGSYVDHICISPAPWGICHHSKNRVAISKSRESSIAVVKVSGNTLKQLYEVESRIGGNIYGISYFKDGKCFMTADQVASTQKCTGTPVLGSKYSMHSVGSDSSVNTLLQLQTASLYMVNEGNNIIFSSTTKSSESMAVGRYSPHKPVQSLATATILKGTHGIDVDKDGNIYACGNASHNIVQMSPTGGGLRELLREADGVRCPLDISVLDNRLAVTFDSWNRRNRVYIYNMDL